VVGRNAPEGILTTFDEKIVLMQERGASHLVRVPFDAAFRQLSPDAFVKDALIGRLRAAEWVMGVDHRFGKDRAGGPNSLHNMVSRNDICTLAVDLFASGDHPVSSSDIRSMVTAGDVARATEMLGHPYLIAAERVAGQKVGSQLGFPTLNFAEPDAPKTLPPAGVYAAELQYGVGRHPGALYYGTCPTFGDRKAHFEMHLLSPVGDAPEVGETAHLWIHRFIRPDVSFATSEELTRQIKKDIESITQLF
jgi:riboflavin kinase/FMN adenylyltransferase